MLYNTVKLARRHWKSILWTAAAALACFGIGEYLTIERTAHAQISTVTPFVLYLDSYNYESNPDGTLFYKKTVARRSDGSTAVIAPAGPLQNGHTTKRITHISGVGATIFDLIAAKTTWRMRSSQLAFYKQRITNPPTDCLFWDDARVLNRESMFGVNVSVVQRSEDDRRTTWWFARSLGCEALRTTLELIQADGTTKLTIDSRAIRLDFGEPPTQFFDAASSYEELAPSGAQRKYMERAGYPFDHDSQVSAERQDRAYNAQRVPPSLPSEAK